MRHFLLLVTTLSAIAAHAQGYGWDWAWSAGSAGSENAQVSVSPQGDVHVYGGFENSIDANGTTLMSSGQDDGFVLSLAADGSVIWSAVAHHTGSLTVHDVAYRSSGEVVVCGTVFHNGDAAQFGTFSLEGMEFGTQAFVGGLSPAGEWLWVSGVDGAISTEGWLVEVDAADAILLGCRWGNGLAVYRYTGAGVAGWSASATSTGSSVDLYAMDVLPDGDLVLTGRCYGTGTFGANTISVSGNFYDAYVARLSVEGDWTWVRQAGGSHWDKGFGVIADEQGDVYVAGTFRNTATFGTAQVTATGSNNDGWLAKLNGNGDWQWIVQMGSTAYMEVYGMDMNDDGDRLVLTGSYAFNTPTIGGYDLPAPASNDLYVIEYSTAGEVLGAYGAGSIGNDNGSGVAYDTDGALYVAGIFGAPLQLGPIALTSVATPDLWVGRLSPVISTGSAVQDRPDPVAMRYGSDGNVWMATNGAAGELDVFDARGRQVLGTQLMGSGPHALGSWVAPAGLHTWIFTAVDGHRTKGKVVIQ